MRSNQMKWAILAATAATLAFSGCAAETKTQQQQAQAQWADTRATVLYGLARDQYQNGNFDKCRATLNDAIRIDPNNAKLHVLSGKLAIEQGKLELAEQELKLARQFDSKDAEADYLSGVVCQRWQKPEAAYEFYSHAAEKMPSELSYVLAKSEMLVGMNRQNEALAVLEEKITYFEHSAVIRDAAGQLLVQQGRYADGIELLRSATVLANDDKSIREHMATALYFNKQFREASDIYTRLLADHSNDKRADLYLAQGQCQLRLNRLGEARGSFDIASQLDPENVCAWTGLAEAALQSNDKARTELALQRAMKLSSATPSSQLFLMMGYLRLQENRPAEALTAFTKASELDQTDTTGLCMMGCAMEKLGRSADAQKCYVRALQIEPKDPMAAKLLAGLDTN